jgi:hypothetical protein
MPEEIRIPYSKVVIQGVRCRYCGKEFDDPVIIDEEGNEEVIDVCDECARDMAYAQAYDELKEKVVFENKTWSELVKENKMNETLGKRQYIKLEPAQKIFNTLLMTLGGEWLKENVENKEKLINLVKLAVDLADELVEKLYRENQ